MSKLKNLPQKIGNEYRRADIVDVLNAITRQVDALTEGGIAALDNAQSVTPAASVAAAQGDMVRNSAMTVLGGAGSKYVVVGFACVASGTPGTWVELRAFTGS